MNNVNESISAVINRLSHWWLSVRLSIGWLHWLHLHRLHWDRLSIWHRLRIISRDDDSGSLITIHVVHRGHLCLKLLLLSLTIAIAGNGDDDDDSEDCTNNSSRDGSGACFGLIVVPALVVISRAKAVNFTAV